MVDRGKFHDAETNREPERPGARIAVRWLPVGTLNPKKRNARIHSGKQIARIADSIKAFGFNVPGSIKRAACWRAMAGCLRRARPIGFAGRPGGQTEGRRNVHR